MLTNVKDTIKKYNMINKGDTVITALSGGADSVALLFSLYSIKDELQFTIEACHVNHNLRGKESNDDQKYCEDLCSKLGIPLTVKSVDVMGTMKKHQSVEECARNLRYEFFSEIGKGKKIATAHTASDNAETVLFNLTRGSALKGLCGIPPVRENIIRPVIYCTREEIEKYCSENELFFVTDKTNFALDYTRNKLRHITLPQLFEINPNLLNTISRMTLALNQDNSYIEAIAEKALKEAEVVPAKYSINTLNELHIAILNRVISRILTSTDVSPSNLRITEIAQIIRAEKGKINIAKYKFAIVKKGLFYIEINLEKFRKFSHNI